MSVAACPVGPFGSASMCLIVDIPNPVFVATSSCRNLRSARAERRSGPLTICAMNIHKLNHGLHNYDELRRSLLEANPEIDTLNLADTLESITDLHDIIATTARSILVD